VKAPIPEPAVTPILEPAPAGILEPALARRAAIDFAPLPVTPGEPLRLEIEGFLEAMSSRRAPRVTGVQALRALEAAFAVLDRIEVHSRRVAQTLKARSGEPGGF
jgi:hypothetical protein